MGAAEERGEGGREGGRAAGVCWHAGVQIGAKQRDHRATANLSNTHKHTHKHTQTHTNTHKHTQTHANTHKHTQTHTRTHVNRYLAEAGGNNALPAVMALGYIGAFSETLALAVIAERVRCCCR